MSRIGDLTVRVGADISNLRRGLDGATGRVQEFRRSIAPMVKTMAAVGAAATAAATAVFAFGRAGMNALDAQAKLARQLDSTVGGLRALQLASEDAGVATGTINAAMERFSARLGEAQRGSGQAAEALDRLGLNASELAGMDVDQRVAMIADEVARLGLSGAETADVLRQFGIRNREIVNLLRQGGDAIRGARQEVEDYGLAVDQVDLATIEAANDAFSRVGLVVESVRNAISVELAPILLALSKRFNDAARASGGWGEVTGRAIESTVRGIGAVLDAIEFVRRAFQVVGRVATLTFISAREAVAKLALAIYSGPIKAANALIELYNKIPALPDLGGGLEQPEFVKDLQFQADMLGRAAQLVREDIKELVGRPMPSSVLDDVIAQAKTLREEIAAGLGDGGQTGEIGGSTGGATGVSEEKRRKEELDRLREHLGQRVELLRESLATEREIEMERYQQANEDLKESLKLELITKEQYDELKFENHQSHLRRIAELDKQDAAQRNRLQEQQARDQEKIEQEVANYIIGTREDIMRRSAQLLDMFAGESKAAAIASIAINKALSIAQATQNTAVAYTKALTVDPTGALAARVAALGATQVGIIAATGVAQAAGVLSGGGSGGGVSAAGSAGGSGGSAAQAQQPQPAAPSGGTLTVQGISSSSLFTGDAMRELAEEMLDYQRRGGEVVLA